MGRSRSGFEMRFSYNLFGKKLENLIKKFIISKLDNNSERKRKPIEIEPSLRRRTFFTSGVIDMN